MCLSYSLCDYKNAGSLVFIYMSSPYLKLHYVVSLPLTDQEFCLEKKKEQKKKFDRETKTLEIRKINYKEEENSRRRENDGNKCNLVCRKLEHMCL